MGGDSDPKQVSELAVFLRSATSGKLKMAWYSGKNTLPKIDVTQYFDYIKLGAYVESLGGLDSANTNQIFYRIENGKMIDDTKRFQKSGVL
ncbi:MAG: anaerobic ribonucleoside-triphosphate reductase activating protein, partial [Bacteroidales bacterium]|jgi:anaerobic ribonucleoside-triphosphate reductase activating protein|nr:anaerobic ribonucleoside-triphosphate reductase activating protein [Bacteroidales bacterium]